MTVIILSLTSLLVYLVTLSSSFVTVIILDLIPLRIYLVILRRSFATVIILTSTDDQDDDPTNYADWPGYEDMSKIRKNYWLLDFFQMYCIL